MENNNEYLLLQEIYKGAAMGTLAIGQILPLVQNVRFRSDLQTQLQQYADRQQQADQQLKELSRCPKELTGAQTSMLKMAIKAKTLCNQETSHLAQLMIEGSNMGILSLTKVLNSCGDYEPDPADRSEDALKGASPAATLARQVIRMEEENIDRLKVYLS
jgi:hypothetical protein